MPHHYHRRAAARPPVMERNVRQAAMRRRYDAVEVRQFRQSTAPAGGWQQSRLEFWMTANAAGYQALDRMVSKARAGNGCEVSTGNAVNRTVS